MQNPFKKWFSPTTSQPAQRQADTTPPLSVSHRNIPIGGAADRYKRSWYSAITANPNLQNQLTIAESRRLSRLISTLDPLMAKYKELLSIYVCGTDGIRLEPQIISNNGKLNTKLNDTILTHWKLWGDEATADGRQSWHDVEQSLIRDVAIDGEAFVHCLIGRDLNKYGFALKVIDPVLLDHEFTGIAETGNRIVQGIELGTYDRPVAYHFWTTYVDDRNPRVRRERVRVPADEVIHIYDDEHGGQLRGMPWTVEVIHTVARLNEYKDSILEQAQVAASIPIFIETTTDEASDYMVDPTVTQGGVDPSATAQQLTAQQVAAAQGVQIGPVNDPYVMLGNQVMVELPANKKPFVPNFNVPSQQHAKMVECFQYDIAAGLKVSRASLTSDYSQANFSSTRAGTIVERMYWENIQAWYTRELHRKVYAKWLEAQTLLPNSPLKLPSDNASDFLKVNWVAPGFMWIDPLKDMKAWVEARNNNWVSDSYVAHQLNDTDYRVVLKQLADDEAARIEAGVEPRAPSKLADSTTTDPSQDTGTQPAQDATAPNSELNNNEGK